MCSSSLCFRQSPNCLVPQSQSPLRSSGYSVVPDATDGNADRWGQTERRKTSGARTKCLAIAVRLPEHWWNSTNFLHSQRRIHRSCPLESAVNPDELVALGIGRSPMRCSASFIFPPALSGPPRLFVRLVQSLSLARAIPKARAFRFQRQNQS